MKISIIVAMDKNRLIGKEGTIPWRLPADLKHFKRTTMGHPIIMGRKTYQSVGRPLPGRDNIVITRQAGFQAPGCRVAESLDDALNQAREADGAEESFIIGGAEIYAAAIDLADRLYLTEIDHGFDGDVHFPEIPMNQWRLLERETYEADRSNPYRFTISILDRV